MGTDVITSLAGSLDAELEKARETLRGVDDNIKKLFGKEASELNSFGRNRRGPGGPLKTPDLKDSLNYDYETSKHYVKSRRRDDYDDYMDEPTEKRRRVDSSSRPPPMVIGPRIRPRLDSDDEDPYYQGREGREVREGREIGNRRFIVLNPIHFFCVARVVSSGKEKSREEVLAEQRKDRNGRDRNRRMFGALLGTLKQFKQEETKLKDKEEKRAQIEAKLDEAAKKEKEEVKKEKQQLIRDRKLKITEIKRLEHKRKRIAELEEWEDKTKYLANFIKTEAKPFIFYMPKIMNPIMECRMEQSKQYVSELISNRRKIVLEDLEGLEQRSKRYWEKRVDGREFRRGEVDPMDEDIEEELKEIMKREDLADVEVEDFTITVFHNNETGPKVENNNDEETKSDLPEGEEEIKENVDASSESGVKDDVASEVEAEDVVKEEEEQEQDEVDAAKSPEIQQQEEEEEEADEEVDEEQASDKGKTSEKDPDEEEDD